VPPACRRAPHGCGSNGTAGGNGVTDTLAAVEATSRSAMADLRRLLALLRDRVQAVVYAHRYGLHSNFTD
jgi:hypothetical protein